MLKKALIVGGTSGIGLSIALQLSELNYNKIYIVGRTAPVEKVSSNIEWIKFDLLDDDYSIFNKFKDIDTLVISAGFGKVSEFKNLDELYILNSFKVNAVAPLRIVRMLYDKINSNQNFNCAIISSISGFISSPMFSVYSSTKASLNRFIESVNIELEMNGVDNRILNVSPGYIEGTGFDKKENNNSEMTSDLAKEVIAKMFKKEELFIPKYEEVYKDVLSRYMNNPHDFGVESFKYKIQSGRMK